MAELTGPIHVLHVIPSISPRRGGPSTLLKTLTQELVRAGCSVHVATTDDDGAAGRLQANPWPGNDQPQSRVMMFPRTTSFYTYSRSLGRWLREHVMDYDIVHVHALFSHAPLAAARAARRQRIPYVVVPVGTLNRWGLEHRHPRLKMISMRFAEETLLRDAAAVTFASKKERDEALQAVAIPRPRIVPNAFERRRVASPEQLYIRFPKLVGNKVVLFLSRIDETKGLDLLIRALPHLRSKQPNVKLLIAGEGDQKLEDRLNRLAEQCGVAEDIVWAGFLQGEEKDAAFACATVSVLPSRTESFGIAAIESIALGVPTIVSNGVGIARDLEADGAVLVCEQDPASIAISLASVLSDQGLREGLVARGMEMVEAHYSPTAVANQVLSLYRECIEYSQVSKS